MAPDDHGAIWEQWHRHVGLVSAFEGVRFADLPASHVAALHDPHQARLLSSRYLLSLDHLEIKLAQRLVDDHFPNGAALVRLTTDNTIRYVQTIARLPVVSTTADQITFTTYYPAGPFFHRTPRMAWAPDNPTLTIPDPDGDGSRVITSDLSEYRSKMSDIDDISKVSELRDESPRDCGFNGVSGLTRSL